MAALAFRTLTEAVEEAVHAGGYSTATDLAGSALLRLRSRVDETEVVGDLLIALAEATRDAENLGELAEEAREAAERAEAAAADAEAAAEDLNRARRKGRR